MALSAKEFSATFEINPAHQALADKHDARIVTTKDELRPAERHHMALSLLKDLGSIDQVALVMARHLKSRLLNAIRAKTPNKRNSKVMAITGFGAPKEHFEILMNEALGGNYDSFYNGSIPGGERVMDDAEKLATRIDRPTILVGNSRGGLVGLDGLTMLQELGKDELIERVVLISPVCHGIRIETEGLVRKAANILNSNAIADLCAGSEATQYWENYLSKENRKKIMVVSQHGGDVWTSPERSMVEGGTTFITKASGHQAVVAPKSPLFKFSKDLIKHSVATSH